MKFLGQSFQKLEPETRHADTLCCSCDLDLDPMTLTYELGLHTKNEVSRSRFSKVRARTGQTHRQTHKQMRPKLLPAAFAGGNRGW